MKITQNQKKHISFEIGLTIVNFRKALATVLHWSGERELLNRYEEWLREGAVSCGPVVHAAFLELNKAERTAKSLRDRLIIS